MALTSKEMFEKNKVKFEETKKLLDEEKVELENLKNEFKVEERMLLELEEGKSELVENQKYSVIAIKEIIIMQENKIAELDKEFKLLGKKYEVLSRDNWSF